MSTLIAVDPGTRFTSVAVFEDRRLARVNAFKSELPSLPDRINNMVTSCADWLDRWPDTVLVEVPRVYPDQHKKVDPEDLISLSLVAGAFLVLGDKSKMVRPSEWKGQMPKEVCQRRIEKILTLEELRISQWVVGQFPPDLQHNLWDAIGIGLYGVGRFKVA